MKSRKEMLYILSFICVVLIDWVRTSFPWHVREPVINLFGIVMIVVTISFIGKRKIVLSNYIPWLLIWILGTVIGFFWWEKYSENIFLWQYITFSLVIGCFGVAVIYLWKARIPFTMINRKNLLAVLLSGIMTILILLSKDSRIWTLLYLGVFSLFYFIPYTKTDRVIFWRGAAKGVLIGSFLIQIFAFVFRPYDEIRYKGAFNNCNMNALMYLMAFTATLYLLHCAYWKMKKCKNSKRILPGIVLYSFCAVVLFCFILYTMTRTAVLVLACEMIAFILLEVFIYKNIDLKKSFLNMVLCVVGILVLFPAVFLSIRYIPTIFQQPVWWENEHSPDRIHSFDDDDSEKYVSFEDIMQLMFARFGVSDSENSAQSENTFVTATEYPQRIPAATPKPAGTMVPSDVGQAVEEVPERGYELLTEEEAQSSMRIRWHIFKLYFTNLNFRGHNVVDGHFFITENYIAFHAQNVFLQIAFLHGIPAGLCFLILSVWLFISYARLAIRGKRAEDILPILFWIVFIGYGMLEAVWYPGQSVLFFMYLVPKIMIDRGTLKKKK